MNKKRVFLVDDEAAVSRILKLGLERTRLYMVRTEEDPRKALASARGFLPDVILLDIMMPGMDGGELAALMRKDPVLEKIPIIFLTSLISSTDDRNPLGETGSVFIPKPVNFTYLLSCIEKATAPAPEEINPVSGAC